MKRINYSILFLIILLVIPFSLQAVEDYEPSQLPGLVSDFNLSYRILDVKGNPIQGAIDGVASIHIQSEDIADTRQYTLTFYLDRTYIMANHDISLPYDFKWNFKGLTDGEHELFFILKDSDSRLGVLKVNVRIQH